MASSLVAKAGGSQPGSQGKRPFGNIASLSNVGAIALPYWVSKALVSTSVSTESSLFEARLRYELGLLPAKKSRGARPKSAAPCHL